MFIFYLKPKTLVLMGRYYIKILLGSSLLLVSKLSLAQTANYIKTSTYLDASGISRAISADYCNGIGKKIASVSSTTDYIGSYILKNGSLDKLLFDGGYCTFSGNTPQFHYYSLDHLGNVRVVANEGGALEQAVHYYPFGAIFGDVDTNEDLQLYKYNSKELDRMHGLDWYDYGARMYDAAIGYWNGVDKLNEKYYPYGQYAYCLNNPLIAIDIDGLYPKFLLKFHKAGFFRSDYYTLRPSAAYLLSEISGVNSEYIKNVNIIKRGFGKYIPLYDTNQGGGAITLGDGPYSAAIYLTENYFEDNPTAYNNNGYGQDLYNWIGLLSHEVKHLDHIKNSNGKGRYILSFGLDYLRYGHDNTPREKEAINKFNSFKSFWKYVNKNYGKNALEKLFQNEQSETLIIETLKQWLYEYRENEKK